MTTHLSGMDLMMPGMDGATATEIIRKKYPGIQVVALTTFDEKDSVDNSLRAGAISTGKVKTTIAPMGVLKD